MRNQRNLSMLGVAIGLMLLLAACSAKKTIVESNLGIKGAPDWVNKGIQFLDDRGGRLFHGVGQAPVMGDESLQKSTAETRARASVARIFSSYMDIVSRDYSSAARSDDNSFSENSIARQIQDFTKLNLSGAKIIAHWKDKSSGIIYALAELDLNQTKKTLGAAEEMSADLRQHIHSNADNVFDKMVKESR